MKTLLNIFIGLGLGLLTIIIHEELNELKRLELTSFLLVLIGSVYYGFALLSKHKKTMVIEIIVATMFVVMGVFGLWFSPWILVIGLFLHGIWDISHHNSSFKLVKIPQWYIPFCATYDWVIGVYLTILYLTK